MSYLDDASLVMIPSGYKDGKLYSVKPSDGAGDFTFTRGSNLAATRVDENGLIEKGRENLILQSNQFDTTWVNSGTISKTSGQSGYDASSDAWLLTKSSASAYIYQNVSSGLATFSVYAKAGTLNWLYLLKGGNSGQYFNLSTGVLGGSAGVTPIDANIENIGGGWYRCSLTYIDAYSGSLRIYPADGDGDVSGTSGSIYIQDAQLEVGLVATDYIETGATTAQAGILEDMPRLDYSGGNCPALLLEPQRTNEFTQSEYFADWDGYQETSNTTTAPDGSEVVFLDFEDKRMFPTTTILNATEYTSSIYLKANKAATVKIRNVASTDVSISLTTDWVRYDVTATSISTITNALLIDARFSQGLGASGLEIAMYGAQLEQGSYPTSYIPTYGTSVTRGQDSVNLSGLSQSFPFTAYIEIDVFTISEYNQFQFRQDALNYVLRVGNQIRVGAAALNTANTLGSNKVALSVDASGNFELFKNGTSLGTGTITETIDQIRSDAAGYEVKEIILFPTALSDADCIALTTL